MIPPAGGRRDSTKTGNRYPTQTRAAPAPAEAAPATSSSPPSPPTEFLRHHSAAPAQTWPNHPLSKTAQHAPLLRPYAALSDHAPLPAACVRSRRTAWGQSSAATTAEAKTASASSSAAQKHVGSCTHPASHPTPSQPARPT